MPNKSKSKKSASRRPPYECGHFTVQRGCGGCDHSAIEFVIEDGTGVVRPFDVTRDMDFQPAPVAPSTRSR